MYKYNVKYLGEVVEILHVRINEHVGVIPREVRVLFELVQRIENVL